MDIAIDGFVKACKSLSSEFRRSLVLYIIEWYPTGATVAELAADYDRSPQYISHNLSSLVDAGLLLKDDKTKRYSSSESWDPIKLLGAITTFYKSYNSISGGLYTRQPNTNKIDD